MKSLKTGVLLSETQPMGTMPNPPAAYVDRGDVVCTTSVKREPQLHREIGRVHQGMLTTVVTSLHRGCSVAATDDS